MSLATTEALGIHQSDIIIRSAIIAALADLRANPWLLDYVFASLARDDMTKAEYGQQEIQRAKEWFQRTAISVIFNVNPNDVKFPCITISLVASAEQDGEGTLADTHYVPFEANDDMWPTLAGPIGLTNYVRSTGTITFDPAALNGLILVPNMLVVDKVGNEYPIVEAVQDGTIQIAAGTHADLGGFLIKPARPAYVTQLESTIFRESYAIGCHVDSEPVHLTYLHSIVVFGLLRYKQAYLEARGFERSVINSSDFRRDDQTLPEFVYSRYVSVSGSVRNYWPKSVAEAARGVSIGLAASRTTDSNTVDIPVDETQDSLSALQIVIGGPTFRAYYGAGLPGSINSAFVKSLNAEDIASVHNQLFALDGGTTNYVFVAVPSAQATVTGNSFVDAQTGELAGFAKVATLMVDGLAYDVWRSNQAGLGSFIVKVL